MTHAAAPSRLRRFFGSPLTRIVAGVFAVALAAGLASSAASAHVTGAGRTTLPNLAGAAAALLAYWAWVRLTERREAFFAAAYLRTRRLWLGIGIHVAWNYTLGTVFSVAVSGRESRGWVEGRLHGPDWLTGGAYGLEASVLTLFVLLVVGAVLLRAAARSGSVRPYPGQKDLTRPLLRESAPERSLSPPRTANLA